MKKIKHICFLLTVLFSLTQKSIIAQQIFLSNQHIVNKFSLSPAYAGIIENSGIYGSFRKDWVGTQGAPELNTIFANGPVSKNMGLGGSVSAKQAGIFTSLSAMVNYAYHVKLSNSSYLSFGLGLGILENHLRLPDNEDQIDPLLNTIDRNSSTIDASVGILFRYKNLHFGFGSPRILSNKEYDSKFIWTNRQVHLGKKFIFSKSWAIDPVIIFYPKEPMFSEISVPIIFQQKVWLTLIYLQTGDAGIGIGANLHSNFVFNYTFEWYEHGLAHRSGGTHEITLGWRFVKNNSDLPKKDKKKPYLDWINK